VRLSEAVARNVAAERTRRRMEQKDLAVGMARLGHDWKQPTVADVEGGRRRISLDELVGLALVLNRTIPELLRPSENVDVGIPGFPMSPAVLDLLLRGKVRISPRWADGELADPPFKVTRSITDPDEMWEELMRMAGEWEARPRMAGEQR
jgi:transcriptional regulator with XRE-family HTH domain